MPNRPRKDLRREQYDKQLLKERIDAAMTVYVRSGKQVQRWLPELAAQNVKPCHGSQCD